MTQILDLVGDYLGPETPKNGDGLSAPDAIDRLQDMLTEDAAVAEAAPAPVTDDAVTADRAGDAEIAAVAALQQSVREAQQKAETQLTALVERVRKEEAGIREEIERRHEKELQEVRDSVQLEVSAAVEAALKDQDGRQAEELDRVQHQLEEQHIESLRRVGASVLDSLETLTQRMDQTA